MQLRTTFLHDMQGALGTAAQLRLGSAEDACNLYATYLFCLTIEAARREGATVHFENVEGSAASPVLFRTSPGSIWTKKPAYTHAVIELPGLPALEAHLGIYVSGKSGEIHECDVALVEQAEAALCRKHEVHPRSSKVVMAARCKFSSAGLPLNLARSFIGLTSDIAAEHRFLVTNTASAPIRRLLTSHKRLWSQEAVPGNAVEINRLRAQFETSIMQYRAKR